MHRAIFPQCAIFASVISALVLCNPLAAQNLDQLLPKADAACSGELMKRHQNDPPWDFTTNSRKPTAAEPTVYLHCVFNNDKDNVVDVNWLIPKVKEPVPANRSALSPRYSDQPPLGEPDGCLIFGNLHDKALRAQFWARQQDKDDVNNENGKECLSLRTAGAKLSPTKSEKLADMVAPFRKFFRSSPDPKAGIVTFEGVTGITQTGLNSYESFMTYRLRPEPSTAPFVFTSEYSIVPRWVGSVEIVAKAFFESNPKPIPLVANKGDTPTRVAFSVSGTGNWSLQELEYVVRDGKGVAVTSVVAPVFIPLQ